MPTLQALLAVCDKMNQNIKPIQSNPIMGRSRYQILNEAYPYFHTLTVVGWQPVFTRQESVQILFDSFNWLQESFPTLTLNRKNR
jgi:hypothetical protein